MIVCIDYFNWTVSLVSNLLQALLLRMFCFSELFLYRGYQNGNPTIFELVTKIAGTWIKRADKMTPYTRVWLDIASLGVSNTWRNF